jgi:hypothetical protein
VRGCLSHPRPAATADSASLCVARAQEENRPAQLTKPLAQPIHRRWVGGRAGERATHLQLTTHKTRRAGWAAGEAEAEAQAADGAAATELAQLPVVKQHRRRIEELRDTIAYDAAQGGGEGGAGGGSPGAR